MKKDIFYYSLHVGDGREEYIPSKELVWNAYINDLDEIKVFNIFNSVTFLRGLIQANKEYKEDKEFICKVRSILSYAFWSKYEYELVITSFPPYINKEEYNRLANTDIKCYVNVNLKTGEKIDIYNQVMINWEAFKLYILSNRKLIPKKLWR